MNVSSNTPDRVAPASSSSWSLTGSVSAVIDFSAVDGPGNRFVVFMQGCQFDCLVCHNPCTIPRRPRGLSTTTVGSLVDRIRQAAPFLTGVTVSGGEATLQARFVVALFAALRQDPATAHLSLLIDSNGDADRQVWQDLSSVMDGAMIDLKALDPQTHFLLTAAENLRVLNSIRSLAALGKLVEVRLLLVPGLNDSDDVLTRTGAWLAKTAPGVPIAVKPFHRHGTRPCARDLAEPDSDAVAHYEELLALAVAAPAVKRWS
jgi:pyruvate-formate lyase-activating enzyme